MDGWSEHPAYVRIQLVVHESETSHGRSREAKLLYSETVGMERGSRVLNTARRVLESQ